MAQLDILREGVLEGESQIMELAAQFAQIVIPEEDVDLTHYWVLREDGVEILYMGNLDTFATYVGEVNRVQ